jgi:hypothetical protein
VRRIVVKTNIAAAAIVTLLGSFAVPAIAQDAGANVGADAGVSTSIDTPGIDAGAATDTNVDGAAGAGANSNASGNASTNASANANAGGMSDNTFGSVMSSLNTSTDVDLTAVTDGANVTIITLSSLQGNADGESAALDQALSANAGAMTELHSSISGNAAVMAKLETEGFAAEDVVAIKSNASGSVIVYVDDRA